MAVLDLNETLAKSLRQTVGVDLEGPLYRVYRIGVEPCPDFVLIERLRAFHRSTEHLDRPIACRGVIVGILLEHRLVVFGELLVAGRLEVGPPARIRDDAIGEWPKRFDIGRRHRPDGFSKIFWRKALGLEGFHEADGVGVVRA